MSEYFGVASSGTSAAFFDLDRTLISGSSAFTLALQARKAGLIPNVEFARDAVGAATFKMLGASDNTTDEVRARVLKAVTGMRQSDLQALNTEVLPRLLARLRPEARRLLDRHRHAGRDTYIVSAAPQEIVEPLAHSLGMTSGIGTRSVVVDGVYTGELNGPFCYGEGKVLAMREIADWQGYDLSQCYAYSDSASDLPMLEAVGHPVAVNPDGKLERHARRHGWPIVIFSQRTKSVIRRTAASVATVGIAGASFAAGTAVATARGVIEDLIEVVAPHPPPLTQPGCSGRAGHERELAALGDQRARSNPRSHPLRRAARRGRSRCGTHSAAAPATASPRMCTVSSTVGTHATGRPVLNTGGRERIGGEQQGDRIDRFLVGDREPARHLAPARRLAGAEPAVARADADAQLLEDRRQRPLDR